MESVKSDSLRFCKRYADNITFRGLCPRAPALAGGQAGMRKHAGPIPMVGGMQRPVKPVRRARPTKPQLEPGLTGLTFARIRKAGV